MQRRFRDAPRRAGPSGWGRTGRRLSARWMPQWLPVNRGRGHTLGEESARGGCQLDYASAAADMAHSYGAFGIGLTNSRSVLPVTELVPSMTIGAALLSRFAIGIRM